MKIIAEAKDIIKHEPNLYDMNETTFLKMVNQEIETYFPKLLEYIKTETTSRIYEYTHQLYENYEISETTERILDKFLAK